MFRKESSKFIFAYENIVVKEHGTNKRLLLKRSHSVTEFTKVMDIFKVTQDSALQARRSRLWGTDVDEILTFQGRSPSSK